MCGRYALGTSSLKKRFGILGESPSFEVSYNISPSTYNPVVVRNSPNKIVMMKWGLVPFWTKDPKIGFRSINARSEGIEEKPVFKRPIRSQRCLVPATGFFEWKKLDLEKKEEKIPFYITLKDQNTFSFAGIYDIWRDAEGKEIYTYAIITTSANEMMRDIHDRMPVILDKSSEDRYLNKETELPVILNLLKPFGSKRMTSYPVSKLVNDPGNDSISLLSPRR